MKSQEEDASSKPLGATTSVTREAEGRALACLPCKMVLPPAAAKPGEKGSSKGMRVVHKLSRDQCGYQIQFGEEMYGEEMDGWLLITQSKNFKLTCSDFYWSGSIFMYIYNSIYIIYIYNTCNYKQLCVSCVCVLGGESSMVRRGSTVTRTF